MSQSLINRSVDLRRLLDEGYEIKILSGHLIIYNVPYVNADKQVKKGGILVSDLDVAGDITTRPSNHVVMFKGDHPCDQNGNELVKIKYGSEQKTICEGITVDHSFSSKPADGYEDYHHKMTTYIAIISNPAVTIDPSATAQTYRLIESDAPGSVFYYTETASSRAGIAQIANKIALNRIAIVGLGGTGSYILDFVVKTPVREIHIFDGDDFLQHNAFRSPGAPSAEDFKSIQKKVDYHSKRYASMRKGIFSHEFDIDTSNASLLNRMDFVFLCMDRSEKKLSIIETLEEHGISFIDVGMGIELVDDELQGVLRITTSTKEKRDHVRDRKRISLEKDEPANLYSRNIQIVELNALSASLAVIKWKKLFGFYRDLQQEHFSTYTLDGNLLINEEKNEAKNNWV